MRHAHLSATLLLLALAAESQAETLPTSEWARWLSQEGLVMAGSWEPLPFRVRRDGSPGYQPTSEQTVAYRREHSREMIQRLKTLGVNFVMTHCYKGVGERRRGDAARYGPPQRLFAACLAGLPLPFAGRLLPRNEPLMADLPTERVVRVETGGSLAEAVDCALDGKASLAIFTEESPTESGAKQSELLGVCAEVTERGKQQFVHLVNYRDDPVKHVAVRLHVPGGRRVVEVALASPGRRNDLKVSYAQEGHFVTFVVPQVVIYEAAVISTGNHRSWP